MVVSRPPLSGAVVDVDVDVEEVEDAEVGADVVDVVEVRRRAVVVVVAVEEVPVFAVIVVVVVERSDRAPGGPLGPGEEARVRSASARSRSPSLCSSRSSALRGLPSLRTSPIALAISSRSPDRSARRSRVTAAFRA